MPQVMRNEVVLPGTVGPQQPDDFARFDFELDAVDHAAAAVRFDQILWFRAVTWGRWSARGRAGEGDGRFYTARPRATKVSRER